MLVSELNAFRQMRSLAVLHDFRESREPRCDAPDAQKQGQMEVLASAISSNAAV